MPCAQDRCNTTRPVARKHRGCSENRLVAEPFGAARVFASCAFGETFPSERAPHESVVRASLCHLPRSWFSNPISVVRVFLVERYGAITDRQEEPCRPEAI